MCSLAVAAPVSLTGCSGIVSALWECRSNSRTRKHPRGGHPSNCCECEPAVLTCDPQAILERGLHFRDDAFVLSFDHDLWLIVFRHEGILPQYTGFRSILEMPLRLSFSPRCESAALEAPSNLTALEIVLSGTMMGLLLAAVAVLGHATPPSVFEGSAHASTDRVVVDFMAIKGSMALDSGEVDVVARWHALRCPFRGA